MIVFIKRSLLLLFVFLAASTAKAQVGFDYAQYDLGLGLDFNTANTDAQTVVSTKSARFSFNYNLGPYINYILELQNGELKGGDAATTASGRQFTNAFNSVQFRVQLQAGELIDYSESSFNNGLKNFYVSSGIGFVVNHMKYINRASILTPGLYTDGDDNSNELLIPMRFGYEFKLFNRYNEPGFKIDIGYQHNFILGDGLDGFTAGTQKDSYSQFSIGIKFAIGGVTSYRKQIPF